MEYAQRILKKYIFSITYLNLRFVQIENSLPTTRYEYSVYAEIWKPWTEVEIFYAADSINIHDQNF